ncbi:Conserved_hypothetical protein [Hexamita inflata]|uniref:Uncharacterized protein n=1 Tax=Hexamita inflata TaxID=28002 RepID=A0AA86QYK3_9EUKA|nr:Conserved hypothetical protein [Hexamita inflata]
MNNQFKEQFGLAFMEVINQKVGNTCNNIAEAHEEYVKKQSGVAFDIWKDMSIILDESPKKVHDFYHNTWSKMFCDDISPYRDTIRNYIKEYNGKSTQEAVKQVISHLKADNESLQLHYQTVYQYVNYQLMNANKQSAKAKTQKPKVIKPKETTVAKKVVSPKIIKSEPIAVKEEIFNFSFQQSLQKELTSDSSCLEQKTNDNSDTQFSSCPDFCMIYADNIFSIFDCEL